jgi:DNA-binding NarL/FixJ family response regulator
MSLRPVKLLLIDQFEEDRAALLRRLQTSSRAFDVAEAADGTYGLALFKSLLPDCVVMELKQGDMVGLEVLNLIQAEMTGRPVPVFIWTCLSQEILKSAASMLGVKGYFVKQSGSESALADAILQAIAE